MPAWRPLPPTLADLEEGVAETDQGSGRCEQGLAERQARGTPFAMQARMTDADFESAVFARIRAHADTITCRAD